VLRRNRLVFSVHVDISIRNFDTFSSSKYKGGSRKFKEGDSCDSDEEKDSKESKQGNRLTMNLPSGDATLPKGAFVEAYGKGDIWMVWKPESAVLSAEFVLHLNDHLTMETLESKRANFLKIKHQLGYPFPFSDGVIWQVSVQT
jgi:hypothetical protein